MSDSIVKGTAKPTRSLHEDYEEPAESVLQLIPGRQEAAEDADDGVPWRAAGWLQCIERRWE